MAHDIVAAARQYMLRKTRQHKAPAWLLTELAIVKARELFKYYPKVDKKAVLTALYLAHLHFGIEKHEQHRHSFKSAVLARKFLQRHHVSPLFIDKVVNAIEAHHAHVPCASFEAELMKNAEAFKFLSAKGALIMLHEGGLRGWNFKASREYTLFKMEQKFKLVTLPRCKREAVKGRREILELFNV